MLWGQGMETSDIFRLKKNNNLDNLDYKYYSHDLRIGTEKMLQTTNGRKN